LKKVAVSFRSGLLLLFYLGMREVDQRTDHVRLEAPWKEEGIRLESARASSGSGRVAGTGRVREKGAAAAEEVRVRWVGWQCFERVFFTYGYLLGVKLETK
jgi:hypothetical protein